MLAVTIMWTMAKCCSNHKISAIGVLHAIFQVETAEMEIDLVDRVISSFNVSLPTYDIPDQVTELPCCHVHFQMSS